MIVLLETKFMKKNIIFTINRIKMYCLKQTIDMQISNAILKGYDVVI